MAEPTCAVRIAIADDHQLFRDGLRRLLESEPGFEVVGEAADGLHAVHMAHDTRPDILLLDVAMPGLGGIGVLTRLSGELPCVVLLTAGLDPADLLQAIRLGARGVVLKESATRLLIDSIHRVMAGKYVIGAAVADDLAQAVKQMGAAPVNRYGLTNREIEIVAGVAVGESNRQIAQRLGISLQTVKHHLTSIFVKTGASSRLELALMAIRQERGDLR